MILALSGQALTIDNQKFAQVNIIDFGPGIPKNIQENIFEAYYSTKEGINRGLGLFVVKLWRSGKWTHFFSVKWTLWSTSVHTYERPPGRVNLRPYIKRILHPNVNVNS